MFEDVIFDNNHIKWERMELIGAEFLCAIEPKLVSIQTTLLQI